MQPQQRQRTIMYFGGNAYVFTWIFVFNIVIAAADYLEDYCWKDYGGTIPSDALVCGKDSSGKLLYLGQVLFGGKLIPGKILENDTKIYFEYYNVEYSSTENVKVLCAQYPEKFQWIPTRSTDLVRVIPQKKLVKGGFETQCSTFLGRLESYSEIKVGKVMCCRPDYCYGLYTTDDGKGQLHEVFHVLAYNENVVGVHTSRISNFLTPRQEVKDQDCKSISITLIE